jgi:hypothetical protein
LEGTDRDLFKDTVSSENAEENYGKTLGELIT